MVRRRSRRLEPWGPGMAILRDAAQGCAAPQDEVNLRQGRGVEATTIRWEFDATCLREADPKLDNVYLAVGRAAPRDARRDRHGAIGRRANRIRALRCRPDGQ